MPMRNGIFVNCSNAINMLAVHTYECEREKRFTVVIKMLTQQARIFADEAHCINP